MSVYAIEAKELGRVKIGYTAKDVAFRLKSLQVGSPCTLTLVGTVPGNQEEESRLHNKYASQRISGEWFTRSPELMAEFEGKLYNPEPRPISRLSEDQTNLLQRALVGTVWRRKNNAGDDWDSVLVEFSSDNVAGAKHGMLCISPLSHGPCLTAAPKDFFDAYERESK